MSSKRNAPERSTDMPLRRTHKTTTFAAAALAVAALGAGGTALAQSADQSTPTTVQVSPAPSIGAGATAPFDAPGVKAIRRGKPIPAGYVLIGYRIQAHRGAKMAGAALRFLCPDGKQLASFGTIGNAGFSAERDYTHHRLTFVTSWPNMRDRAGNPINDADGKLYAVCGK
jgi:hypothetical protein